jgi:GH24 family phage-related lysozyme (muramidase)
MNLDAIKALIRSDEGLRLERYLCTQGRPTIGYGHAHGDIPETCTLEEAEDWLDADVQQAIRDATKS